MNHDSLLEMNVEMNERITPQFFYVNKLEFKKEGLK